MVMAQGASDWGRFQHLQKSRIDGRLWGGTATRLSTSRCRKAIGRWNDKRGERPSAQPARSDAQPMMQMFQAMVEQLNYMQQGEPPEVGGGTSLLLRDVVYQPPSAVAPLLNGVSLELPAGKAGVIYGRSGSGKSTLLQVVAGLTAQDSGVVCLQSGRGRGAASGDSIGGSADGAELEGTSVMVRQKKVGLVFQFPERHFLGVDILQELIHCCPRLPQYWAEQQQLMQRLPVAMTAVGIHDLDINTPTAALSDGYKRRLALAVQLVRQPDVLLLDEPLAGLDWRARADLVQLLPRIKRICTLLIVSHDIAELASLVDTAWEMKPGGCLVPGDVQRIPRL